MSEDDKIFDQKPATVTNMLEVLALADRPLKDGYVVATEANLTELTKNFKDIRETPSFIDLLDIFGSLLDKGYVSSVPVYPCTWEECPYCRERKCQMETKIFDSQSINDLTFAEALELLDFQSHIPADVICHPSWEECPHCHGDKQQWSADVQMMEDCFLCRSTGKTTLLTSAGYRAGKVTKESMS